jgi:hypothetical protein
LDISNYTAYFHDGSIIDIDSQVNDLIISLESAELDPLEIDDSKLITKSNTIFGKLHLKNVKKLKLDNKPYLETLRKTYDSGEILDLEIDPNRVFLLVEWANFPPKTREFVTNTIEIEAEKVEWENIPTAGGYKFQH